MADDAWDQLVDEKKQCKKFRGPGKKFAFDEEFAEISAGTQARGEFRPLVTGVQNLAGAATPLSIRAVPVFFPSAGPVIGDVTPVAASATPAVIPDTIGSTVATQSTAATGKAKKRVVLHLMKS